MHKMVRLSLVSLATVCAACASAGSYSQPPWMNFFVSPAPTYSASRERHHSRHSRVAHNHSPVRESAVTTVSAGSVPDDKPAPAPVVASNAPVTLSLAGDGMDRTRAQQLLVTVDSRLERVHSRKLSKSQKETYERASQLAGRARRALADNDCAAAPPLGRARFFMGASGAGRDLPVEKSLIPPLGRARFFMGASGAGRDISSEKSLGVSARGVQTRRTRAAGHRGGADRRIERLGRFHQMHAPQAREKAPAQTLPARAGADQGAGIEGRNIQGAIPDSRARTTHRARCLSSSPREKGRPWPKGDHSSCAHRLARLGATSSSVPSGASTRQSWRSSGRRLRRLPGHAPPGSGRRRRRETATRLLRPGR